MKVTTFTAKQNSESYKWSFWYDSSLRRWFLKDYDGYVRPLETTWIDSVPLINLILENHGMTANIS